MGRLCRPLVQEFLERNNDRFGSAVSLDGDTVLVGAPYDDDQGDSSGSAYIFVRSGTVWAQQTKLLAESGRPYLSKDEKRMAKDHVMNVLSLRVPSTPNIYDIVWNIEEGWLWFFTNMKNANEEIETLFLSSFKLTLIRLFPYTMADLTSGLSDSDKDTINHLSFTHFGE